MTGDAEQLKLFEDNETYKVNEFSHGAFCEDCERRKIEERYFPLTDVTSKFNRQTVSFQESKKASVYGWLKYKEGFSPNLVDMLLKESDVQKGGTVLDPFLGSGTTALVCKINGINCIGYDIMPFSTISINAKSRIYSYKKEELENALLFVQSIQVPESYKKETPSIKITDGAFPESTSHFLSYISEKLKDSIFSDEVKDLITLSIVNSLESISYTSKDGQFLGWDSSCPKITEINKKRIESGKKPLKQRKTAHAVLDPKQAIYNDLQGIVNDILCIQSKGKSWQNDSHIEYHQKSSLLELPKLEADSISGVITSPPYCNRYDYTRTYALELAYLGMDDAGVKHLRQELLSCTVESKSKIDSLKSYYSSLNRTSDLEHYLNVLKSNKALQECLEAMEKRKENGDLNNKGVINMVKGYFTELGIMFGELFRISKKGARICFVNDNVRYGGEIIPVDFLCSSIAEEIGFKVVKIYTLKQQKGNSSQQMKKYGRVPLRKSITIWEK